MAHLGIGPSARITTELIQILNHPVRREALRLLHRAPNGQMGGGQIRKAMAEGVPAVGNHVRIMREAGAIVICDERPVRNVKEKWYESLVFMIPTVVAVLDETEVEDALIRRG
jgi:DNA-binding transcriptional ArsR family regulator